MAALPTEAERMKAHGLVERPGIVVMGAPTSAGRSMLDGKTMLLRS